MKTKKSPHPEWALAHKKPGTELRKIKGRYYLYDYKTVYDKEKKRAPGRLPARFWVPSPRKRDSSLLKNEVWSKPLQAR